MIKDRVMRFTGVRRRTLCIVAALIAPLASLGVVAPALAKEPTGVYAVYKQCPRFTAVAALCQYSQITSGEVTLNGLTVPITNTITFQGGITPVFSEGAGEEASNEVSFVEALNGETFSKTPQEIPGGLSALINCNDIKGRGFLTGVRRSACRATLGNPWLPRHFRAAYETTELAEPASEIKLNRVNAIGKEGTALWLPVRFHLENPLLGKNCYIGSSTNPIVLNLTTGVTSPPPPNKPISGSIGAIEFLEEGAAILVKQITSVDNTFAAPAATGCGGGPLSSLIDQLINEKIGLPSPAGYNTVIHTGLDEDAVTTAVIASEQRAKR
jgi:hypothetical protein